MTCCQDIDRRENRQTNKRQQLFLENLLTSLSYGLSAFVDKFKISSHHRSENRWAATRTLLQLVWAEGRVFLPFLQTLWFTHHFSFINFILLTTPHSHLQGYIVLFPVFQGEVILAEKRRTNFPEVTQGFVNRIKIRLQLMSLRITLLIFLPHSIQRGSK